MLKRRQMCTAECAKILRRYNEMRLTSNDQRRRPSPTPKYRGSGLKRLMMLTDFLHNHNVVKDEQCSRLHFVVDFSHFCRLGVKVISYRFNHLNKWVGQWFYRRHQSIHLTATRIAHGNNNNNSCLFYSDHSCLGISGRFTQ